MSRVNLYSVFHLNLAFSSIPEKNIPLVIHNCYWPLLRLADDLNVKIGIEATGYTLEKIGAIDPRWIEKLKQLIKKGKCEFIGSGYAQIIGPLVPAEVNKKNLEFGADVYKKLLGVRPVTAYVNEQTYAQGLVSVYLEAGYEAIITEWNNAIRFHHDWEKTWQYHPQYAVDQKNAKIALIWNNTTAFQKFQSYAEGELDLDEYIDYLKSHIGTTDRFLPIYGSDAEVFDFRPGRFAHESLDEKIEWKRIRRLFTALLKDSNYNFISPATVLALAKDHDAFHDLHLESPEQPIVVKKQEKYNVTRWALTGVNDLSINTKCFQIYYSLKEIDADPKLAVLGIGSQKRAGLDLWKELCFLWSSDFRTHIEQKKFDAFLSRLDRSLAITKTILRKKGPSEIKKHLGSTFPKISVLSDAKSLTVETGEIKVILNKEKGLAIDSLVFKQLSDTPIIRTLSRGYFGDIALEEDFFSGHVDIKIPGHKEISDLGRVAPIVIGHKDSSSDSLRIEVSMQIDFGTIKKTVSIYKSAPRIDITYDFDLKDLPPASFRSGILTLNPEAFDLKTLYYRSMNGGNDQDTFNLGDSGAITAGPLSLLVSARSALGNTGGVLEIGDKFRSVVLTTDMTQSAALPMINFAPLPSTFLLRTLYSLAEIDDTSLGLRTKHSPFKRRFSLSISPKKAINGRTTKKDTSRKPLYQTADGYISSADLARVIANLGVKKGDTILVHSDVSVFGSVVEGDREIFFGSLIDLLKKVVGKDGTIIMPTFTYTMTEDKIFDVSNSPSSVGALTEYFRKLPNVTRTVDPILSVAIWGKHKGYLSNIGTSSLGRRSFFDKFRKRKGKIVLFGSRSCTYFHHIENMYGVPYRFEKKFRTTIRDQGRTYDAEYVYYARRLDRKKNVSHFSIAAADMEKGGLLKKIQVGRSAIAVVGADALYKEVVKKLDLDQNYYVRSDLSELEEKKLT